MNTYRHGDLIFTQVSQKDEKFVKQKHSGEFVLALGEVATAYKNPTISTEIG